MQATRVRTISIPPAKIQRVAAAVATRCRAIAVIAFLLTSFFVMMFVVMAIGVPASDPTEPWHGAYVMYLVATSSSAFILGLIALRVGRNGRRAAEARDRAAAFTWLLSDELLKNRG